MKNVKIIDIAIICGVILALLIGFLTYSNFRRTASKQIEATSKISFEVYLRSVTITDKKIPIKAGEKTFISIRNVPYSDLEVVDVKTDTKKVVLPNVKGGSVITEDASQPSVYDMVITVVDNAKITKDGAVVGGNKVKMGLPITLEGKDYKFNGIVSSIQILPDVPVKDDEIENDK